MRINNISTILIIAVLLLLCFISCAKDYPSSPVPLPLPPSASGVWSGMPLLGGVSDTITLRMIQYNTQVRVDVYIGNNYIDLVEGINQYPNISWNSSYTSFTGSFISQDQISGFISCSGLSNMEITFTKN